MPTAQLESQRTSAPPAAQTTRVDRCASVPPHFVRQDERGTFVDLVAGGQWETVITGNMEPGAVMGNHYHKATEMFFYLLYGGCWVDVECVRSGKLTRTRVQPMEGVHLFPFESHAIRFDRPSGFILLKSKGYDPNDPDTYAHPVAEPRQE